MSGLDLDVAAAIKRAQAGDELAFHAIYSRFADALFRFLYARCGDATLAEELTSELWVRVVERLQTFRFPVGDVEAAFAGWLYRIARNLLIDDYRRRRIEPVPLLAITASREAALEQQILDQEEHHELRVAMEKLTVEQREVLMLRFVEDRSNAEVASLTGRSEGAVRVMQHRALGALARILGRDRVGKSG